MTTSQMTTSQPDCVFINFTSQFAHLCGAFARRLKSEHDLDSVLLVSDLNRIPKNPERIGLVLSEFREVIELKDLLVPRPAETLPPLKELAEHARAIELRYDVSLIHMIRTDRHLGFGFITGADFPRSRYSRSVTYAQAIDITIRLSEFCEALISKHRPAGVFGSAGSIFNAPLIDIANSLGIRTRYPVKGRKSEEQFHWAVGRHGIWWGLREAYEHRFAQDPKDANRNSAGAPQFPTIDTPFRARKRFKSMVSRPSIFLLIRGLAIRILLSAKRSLSGRKVAYGGYRLRDIMRVDLTEWLKRRRLSRASRTTDAITKNMPYVFYPLQVEPESNMFVEVPESDNQLSAIDWLCKALPGGWHLVVKEHPSMTTPRPKGFWERIHSYPNLIVAAEMQGADELCQDARALAMINSTVGFQAAVKGIPVISFALNFSGCMMPHVTPVASFDELQQLLRKICDGDLPSIDARLRAAWAFVGAIDDCAITIDDPQLRIGRPSRTPISDVDAMRLTDSFVQSIRFDGPYSARGGTSAVRHKQGVG